ncbi:hypothetical protein [Chryseobacterium indoltheticum]|uniref:hypothetical protein n=1 Tax=Chryseobacterium indoltheticum TaxID=254 RepID=UPI003F49A518
MFIFLTEIVGTYTYAYFFGEKYHAKVVKYDYTEGDSDSEPTRIAIVEFKNKDNQTIQKSLGYSTSIPVELGKTILISYDEGDKNVKNLSFFEQKTISGLVIFFFAVFALAFTGILFYVLGRDISFIWRILMGFMMYIIFPCAMLFFIIVLSWVIWEYFEGRRDDMPIWALGICSLFVTLLIPALVSYFKMLFDKKNEFNKNSNRMKFKKSKFSKRIPK